MSIPKRIPGFVPGILFLLVSLSLHASPLAWDLYREGNWTACATEARRAHLADPADESARFLLAASAIRQAPNPAAASNLLALARGASHSEVRACAALEASRFFLAQARPADACLLAAESFLTAADPDVFQQSLAILHHIRRHTQTHVAMTPDLERQYLTCEPLVRHMPEPFLPPGPDSIARRIGTAPGRWIVSFYRKCVRPAIGDRCSLAPNCSEYFLLATRKHGLLGIPMLADRLVREPSVVANARYPMTKARHTVYHDPVEHHDFWMANP